MLMSVASKHRGTELVRESVHQLPCSVTAFDGEEVEEGEVQKEGLEDLALHRELEGV